MKVNSAALLVAGEVEAGSTSPRYEAAEVETREPELESLSRLAGRKEP